VLTAAKAVLLLGSSILVKDELVTLLDDIVLLETTTSD